jgi:hypothetical protein
MPEKYRNPTSLTAYVELVSRATKGKYHRTLTDDSLEYKLLEFVAGLGNHREVFQKRRLLESVTIKEDSEEYKWKPVESPLDRFLKGEIEKIREK